jgi:hypothetical protein
LLQNFPVFARPPARFFNWILTQILVHFCTKFTTKFYKKTSPVVVQQPVFHPDPNYAPHTAARLVAAA